MICDINENRCISNIFFLCLSIVYFLVSCSQMLIYAKHFKSTSKTLKCIVLCTNLLTIFMISHFSLESKKYNLLFVLMEFFLYLDFCLIALFYVLQASNHLGDSGKLIKIAKLILSFIFVILFGFFVYFAIVVSISNLNCKTIEWTVVKCTSFVMGCCFFTIGIKLSYRIRQKKKQGFVILDNREQELWYNLGRILIFLIFLSVLISFVDYLTPIIVISECDVVTKGDSVGIVVGFSIERIFTHYLPIGFSVFVFWYQRRQQNEEKRVRHKQRASSKSLSLMDMEFQEDQFF